MTTVQVGNIMISSHLNVCLRVKKDRAYRYLWLELSNLPFLWKNVSTLNIEIAGLMTTFGHY